MRLTPGDKRLIFALSSPLFLSYVQPLPKAKRMITTKTQLFGTEKEAKAIGSKLVKTYIDRYLAGETNESVFFSVGFFSFYTGAMVVAARILQIDFFILCECFPKL